MTELTRANGGDGAQPASGRARGRPKTRPDEAERERIVRSARELFLDVGYGGTTMDAVASRCGVSKRTLYRLFPAKSDLFRVMVADHRRSMLALPRDADEDLPLAEALAAIFRLDSDAIDDRERLAFVRLVLADSDRFSEIGEMIAQEGAQPARRLLEDWLVRQQARGALRAFPADALARMLMDMIFSVLIKRFPGDRLMTAAERQRHARLCLKVFLEGVAATPA
ncbi:TetR/AcrR family transcriptional regulator [Bosea sp. (in: a-proteobacteria)]|uniref:TetR/AcrR family transcriptional regulator n=1 Tax=Bosea sp. (in: a-proteobacteria) TaxID=1871050 RepID=UPI00260CE9A2|nr:TetR/AcrR family transcriptional regulator [Bosea sp. (in: a-proteobacteria)]MCO5093404.1 TetR/AcrR family transcriptional regulator [Bosea sp. (in: a-proteobacteria)]